MLLSPLGPRGKLRPEWEFGSALREHSLAAGPGPVYACHSFCCPYSCSPQLQSAHNADGRLQKTPGRTPSELGLKALRG